MRFSPGCCRCVTGNLVLLWNTDQDPISPPALVNLTVLKGIFTTLGATAHLSDEWTGTLSDYVLIIWPLAVQNPSWWAQISGGTWEGRLVITAEYTGFVSTTHDASRDYVNGIPFHGMTVGDNYTISIGCSPGEPYTASVHNLTFGQSVLRGGATASVSGGTTLYTALSSTFFNDNIPSATPSLPMMQQAKSGLIDWVVSGDSNPFIDQCPNEVNQNVQFFYNLWTVPIPP